MTRFERVFEKTRASRQNNNEYIVPISNTKLHLEYMQTATINGTPYFESYQGKTELEFCFKMADRLESLIRP